MMSNSAAFNFMCSNVSATNLTQCSFLPAAASTINQRFDASNANFTLRATFSFEAPSSRRDTEDVLLTTGLTIDHSTPTASTTGHAGSNDDSSHTAVIVAAYVAFGVGLLLLLLSGGMLIVVVTRLRVAARRAPLQTALLSVQFAELSETAPSER